MTIDEPTLMAFADGELPPEEAARVAAAIAADSTLAARVERMRHVRGALNATYDPVLQEPVPDRLAALLDAPAAAGVVDLAAARARKRGFGAPAWTAIAASMVLGVLVGRMAAPEALFEGGAGQLTAGAALTRVLNERLAAEGAQDPTRVGLSFRARDGAYCRTFSHESGVSGLACREADRWAVRIAVQERASQGGFRQASAPAPAVLEAVDALIDGEPLTAAEETAARDSGWR